jgi:GYF domain 2
MSAEWYYTTNKQQMGPVSWDELRELAEGGILKPHDMVWCDGMDEWVKAINQKGLFADGEDAVTASPKSKKRSSYSEPKPPPGRRSRKTEEEDDEDDEEDDKEKKRKARKKEEDRAKMGIGFRVFLGIGAVVGLLLLGTCVCGGIGWLTFGGKDGPNPPPKGGGNPPPVVNNQPGQPRRENYNVANLQPNGSNTRNFNFTQGRTVTITSTNNTQMAATDVDLYVFRGNGPGWPNENPVVSDVRIPNNMDRNCRVTFVVPATGNYRVTVVNLGPGFANNCNVQIEER